MALAAIASAADWKGAEWFAFAGDPVFASMVLGYFLSSKDFILRIAWCFDRDGPSPFSKKFVHMVGVIYEVLILL